MNPVPVSTNIQSGQGCDKHISLNISASDISVLSGLQASGESLRFTDSRAEAYEFGVQAARSQKRTRSSL